MKIKQKIRLGLGLIFIVVLFFGVISIYFISQLSNSSKVILKNNYETLAFTREMRAVLDENSLPLSTAAQAAFSTQLVKQEHNITEKGEREATARVRASFAILQSATASLTQQEAAVHNARVALRAVEGLNMRAVVVKTDVAQASVDNAVLTLGIVCCFTFLLLFSFSVNISAFVADPLIKLREAFAEISKKNYDHRIGFGSNQEFEELTSAFNMMAATLRERDKEGITDILTEKNRITAVIDQMPEAVIITDANQQIAFINTAAQTLFKLEHQKVTGKAVGLIASSNKLFHKIFEVAKNDASYKFEVHGHDEVFQLETIDIFVPNIDSFRSDELNIARLPAGKIYILRQVGEMHAI